MKILLLIFLLAFSLILETSLIQLPIVLLVLLVWVALEKTEWIFPVSIIMGFLLDSLLFRPLGTTSLFFLVFFFMVFLYEQKFEFRSISFVFVMSFFGSVIYLLLFGSVSLLLQLLVSCMSGVVLFILISFVDKKQKRELEFAS